MKMDDKLMKLFYVTLVHEYNLVFWSFCPKKLGTSVISGLRSSSKSGTEQFVSSKNELKLIHTVSISNSVNGGKQSKYSGLREFLVNVPISRRWYCKLAIFSDWDKASYLVGISKIFDSRKIVFLRFEFILPFPDPSVDWTFFLEWKRFSLRIQFFHVNVSKTRNWNFSSYT